MIHLLISFSFPKEKRLPANSDLIICFLSDQGRAVEQRIQCSGESWPQVRATLAMPQ